MSRATPALPNTPCATCGAHTFGGCSGSWHGQEWFVCWQCNEQDVEQPPLPRAAMDRMCSVLARGRERRLREQGHEGVVVTWAERDPTQRPTWAEVAEHNGIQEAIAAIHRARVDTGWARPLTRLLDAGQAAEIFGVTRPTFRKWLREGKLPDLQNVGCYGATLFREDDVRRHVERRR